MKEKPKERVGKTLFGREPHRAFREHQRGVLVVAPGAEPRVLLDAVLLKFDHVVELAPARLVRHALAVVRVRPRLPEAKEVRVEGLWRGGVELAGLFHHRCPKPPRAVHRDAIHPGEDVLHLSQFAGAFT